MNSKNQKLSYAQAGVDIEAGDLWASVIGKMVKEKGKNKNTVGGIGGFAGLYKINEKQLLAACADGVGTKMELAKQANSLRGLGQDLVAMNVNDLVCCGASPLFFLDYLACGKLKPDVYSVLIEDVLSACNESGCVLLGGETAEMPAVYDKDGFDLAGFSVGLVDTDKLIDGSSVREGDLLVGLPSSGVHSNGFSLVRKVIEKEGLDTAPLEALLKPTRLYVQDVKKVLDTLPVKAMAHVTGGGLQANIERVLHGRMAKIDWRSWTRSDVFDWLSQSVEEEEMRKVFNLGIGFVFVIDAKDVSTLLALLEDAFVFGEVVACA